MDQNKDPREVLTTEDHHTHSLAGRILRALVGVPDEKRGALAAEAERLQSYAERLHHQVRRVRAVIDSPRTMGFRNASFPDDDELIELLVFVKDIRAALDGPEPETVTPSGAGGAPTMDGSIIFFEIVGEEAHLINGVWRWADSGGTPSERELREEDWTLVRDAGRRPGQLRRKFDGGRGAMIDENDRIVGYYNSPTLPTAVTDLFEKWAAEENEHRVAGEYGLAEGFRVASEELRAALDRS